MTGVEIILFLTGCVFMVGSFFVTEKLSPSELSKIGELSVKEVERIVEQGVQDAGEKIEDAIDEQLESSVDKVDRALEKETNEKIMAISEYSDTVLENINKAHNEIMFLYSMLNDKHTELTGMVSDLQRLAADVRNLQENISVPESLSIPQTPVREQIPKTVSVKMPPLTEIQKVTEEVEETEENEVMHKSEIIALHKDGMSEIEIAKKLQMGVGEVRLVIGLYRGE